MQRQITTTLILSAEVGCAHCQRSRYHCVFYMKLTEIMNVTNVQLDTSYAFNYPGLTKNSPTLANPLHAKVMQYALNPFQKRKEMMRRLLMNQIKNRSLTIHQFYLTKIQNNFRNITVEFISCFNLMLINRIIN